MTTTAPVQLMLSVTSGPSANRVVDSFKYAFAKEASVPVTFGGFLDIGDGSPTYGELSAQVTGISYESGTPGMFNVQLNIKGHGPAHGFYDANKRIGLLRFER